MLLKVQSPDLGKVQVTYMRNRRGLLNSVTSVLRSLEDTYQQACHAQERRAAVPVQVASNEIRKMVNPRHSFQIGELYQKTRFNSVSGGPQRLPQINPIRNQFEYKNLLIKTKK